MGPKITTALVGAAFVYTLDTNAIIYYIKEDASAVSFIERILSEGPIYISTVTELELFSFSKISSFEEEQLEAIMQTVVPVALDSRLARIAGFLRRIHRLHVADSAIAATAMLTGSRLVTRNVRDFQHIPDLVVLKI